MNETAFACPLYDMRNHFELAFNLYKSKLKLQIPNDLYFIFSSEEQKDKFYNMIHEDNSADDFKYLIEPEEYKKYKAQAIVKKFYALDALKEKYKYVILVDSESLFIRKCDFDKLAEYIWSKKTVLNSNISYDGFFIMRDCFKTMGLYNNRKLRKDTNSFKYNFWFNELQVYPTIYLKDFFDWLKGYNIEEVYNNKMCFEYYVFYAYLLLNHDIHLNKFQYKSMGGVNEYIDIYPVTKQQIIMKEMDLHWTSSKNAINENTMMLFHLDRNDKGYGYDLMKNKNKLRRGRVATLIKDSLLHH